MTEKINAAIAEANSDAAQLGETIASITTDLEILKNNESPDKAAIKAKDKELNAANRKLKSVQNKTAKLQERLAKAEERAAKAKQKAEEKEARKAEREANRMPEQNGVRRPKPDTVCGKVWQIADTLSEQFNQPTPIKQLLEACVAEGMNPGNVKAEYARWRKFNNIVGRISLPKENAE